MDFAPFLKQIIDFIVYFLGKEFVFAGYTATIGAVVMWSALALIVIGIIRGLAD